VTAKNKANKTAAPKEVNHSAGTQDDIDTSYSEKEAKHAQEYCVCHHCLLILELSRAQNQRIYVKSLRRILVLSPMRS
ncbi:hypothetical protein Tco_0589637, partial [Tanacetum coccineum]